MTRQSDEFKEYTTSPGVAGLRAEVERLEALLVASNERYLQSLRDTATLGATLGARHRALREAAAECMRTYLSFECDGCAPGSRQCCVCALAAALEEGEP